MENRTRSPVAERRDDMSWDGVNTGKRSLQYSQSFTSVHDCTDIPAGPSVHSLYRNFPLSFGQVSRGLRTIWEVQVRHYAQKYRRDTLFALLDKSIPNVQVGSHFNDKQEPPVLHGRVYVLDPESDETTKSARDCRKAKPKCQLRSK